MQLFNRFFLWPLLLTGHLLAMSLLSWHVLAQVNFAYAIGYNLLDIDDHIQLYGPQNQYKDHFAQTTSNEHSQIFGAIVKAIQHHGQGLATIEYRLPDGSLTPLMREAEVIHLQDVANLIEQFYIAGIIGVFLWLLLMAYAYYQHEKFPPLNKILAGFTGVIALAAVITLAVGPTEIFYWLHIQIFPDEHEWFFFYQDSLMTTLMKAPAIFGFISVLLMGLLGLLWAISLAAMARGLNANSAAMTEKFTPKKAITKHPTDKKAPLKNKPSKRRK